MFVVDSTTCLDEPAPDGPCGVESSERARQREIAAYLSAASFPPDLPCGPLPEPLLNADLTLNALVQLGAHRLGCDRAFLSFIDRQYQFVVAEITRSHSLSGARHAPNEHIFLGVTKLDACWGVCPTTMDAFKDETGEWIRTGPNVIADRSRYIINDFATEPGYTERPYVVGYPHMRSYLEVPLVSPLGYLLGGYCVVHNDLKEYDDDATIDIMNEIASAIMAHLELRRIEQSRDRSEQLIQGLSGFINNEPTAQQPPRTGTVATTSQIADRLTDPADLTGYPRPLFNHTTSSVESSDAISSPAEKDSAKTPPTTPRDEIGEDPFARIVIPGDTAGSANEPECPATSGSDISEVYANGFISSADIKSTLFRAAATIRRSMNMDGFMFLDAVPSSFADRSDQLAPDDPRDSSREEVMGPFCATIVQSTAGQSGERLSRSSRTRLPEAALQRFIRRFPQGHVFSADEFGPIDEIYAPGKPFPADHRINEENTSLRNDVSALFHVLPAAKYIVFRPLWHFQQECWYAAALGWVSDPTRAIEPGDISLVAAFGNSIMAEVSRLEALATSRAKSDFVSSISHELRSPLHGIMAGSELLREGVSDNPVLLSTLDMLDSCGTTLLDIFNNLLEHAIVTSSGGRYRTTMANMSVTDLGGLVEDVLDVVHMSHLSENAFQSSNHRKGSFAVGPSNPGKSQRHLPLLVTMDIGTRESWKLYITTGAWKRIVMNIFGNALKYTNSGRIQVSLKRVQKKDRSGKLCDYVAFSVEDTGQGMSSDYLKYKLFTPFSQENTHSPGMGLGLSIVQQLASGLGGTVDVKSSVGVGTLVEVLVPAKQDSLDEHRRLLSGRTVCLITPDAFIAMANPRLEVTDSLRKRSAVVEQALRANAGGTLGMNVTIGTAECPDPPADVYLLDSNILNKIPNAVACSIIPSQYSQVTPLVLLCADAGPPSCFKQEVLKGHMFHLHHPLGPRKLASVLRSAIEAGCQPAIQGTAITDATLVLTSPSVPDLRTLSIPSRSKELEVSGGQNEQQHLQYLTSSSHDAAETSNTGHGKSYHLLIVDDNPINVKLLATVLRKLKHSFSTACHGLEAVQLYKDSLNGARSFDMIFMDISMPVMDGFEATREIRELERQARVKRCKIVALTGLSSEESRDEALASGSDVFLTKPVKLDKVRRLMDEELDESR
ncbi:autoinducer 2 sensor kinase/phosphatase luxQ [Coniochaeta ligniaria NRRL 30616]|uniref:histidine kinase n=1 Tax=Coniochaeta ligniaria NRRL 30616 TaxID=1408157 RepID=A0A1J7JUM9_9PEZI|nr:autoinducer 2 sensor kinase/phosphatase luxQ [Coniochaeta ligniaria NRRL 30616]